MLPTADEIRGMIEELHAAYTEAYTTWQGIADQERAAKADMHRLFYQWQNLRGLHVHTEHSEVLPRWLDVPNAPGTSPVAKPLEPPAPPMEPPAPPTVDRSFDDLAF